MTVRLLCIAAWACLSIAAGCALLLLAVTGVSFATPGDAVLSGLALGAIAAFTFGVAGVIIHREPAQ